MGLFKPLALARARLAEYEFGQRFLAGLFQQLIGDLGGTSSSGSSSSSTTALQYFLSTLLQNLQGGGGSASLSALGNSVNATA